MTRKCIMCKSKNYKNACSFFSAPKDSEMRLLWQEAINIKDYNVNEDTYVCSKHFNKDDIITHWVSGVPPQVITIKYKKCRLRPGAVPIRINNSNDSPTNNISSETHNNGIMLDGKKYFIESNKRDFDNNGKIHNAEKTLNESLNCNLEDEIYEYIPEDTQEPEESENETISAGISKRQKLIDKQTSHKEQIIYSTNQNEEILLIDCTNININNTRLKENKNSEQIHLDNTQTILTFVPKKTYIKVKEKVLKKTVQCNISKDSDQIMSSSIDWQVDPINRKVEINEMCELNEDFKKDFEPPVHPTQEIIYCDNTSMAFEEFIEIYNEVSLPSSWFASMVSKGHATTIVYCCMNVTITGMPYVEKNVFLNSEMVLRCGVLNKEMNVIHFFKNAENVIIHTLSDVEDFIKKFDQIPICPGKIFREMGSCMKKEVPDH